MTDKEMLDEHSMIELKGEEKTYPLCYLQHVVVTLHSVDSKTKKTKEDECE